MERRVTLGVSALLLTGPSLATSWAQTEPTPPHKRVIFKETLLARVSAGVSRSSFVVSSDGRRLGYVAARPAGKEVVVVNAARDKEYDQILPRSLVFSPDSKHYGYIAREGRGWRRILDGREGPVFDEVALLTFAPDSSSTAYGARKGMEWRIVVDGTPGESYMALKAELRFTSEGKVVYTAQGSGESQWAV